MEIVVFFDLFLEVIKYIVAGYALFQKKIGKRYTAGIIVVLAGICLIGNIADGAGEASLLVQPFIIVGLIITMDSQMIDRVVYALKLVFLIVCIDYVIETLMKMINGFVYSDEVAWLISNMIALLFYILLCFVRRKQKEEVSGKVQLLGKCVLYVVIVVMVVAMPLTISGLNYFAERDHDSELTRGIQLLSAIAMISVVMLVLFVMYISDTNKKIKKYLEIEKVLKETQKNYFEAMLQKEEDTRRFRHDILNHMMCIRELASKEEARDVKKYVDGIQGELIKIQKRCYCVGNTVIDAVLNYYVQMLEEDVEVQVIGGIADSIAIGDVELCTIFSNIMKNSVEELKKQKENPKYLKIKVHQAEEDFAIQVSNSLQKKQCSTKDGLPVTTKEDKKNHGIGLKNVKETVEKNCGTFYWELMPEEFRVKVILPLHSRG